jgi:hypothetical protein
VTEGHLLANKEDVDLDMLWAFMLHRAGGHVDMADIVAEDDSRCLEG